MTNPFLYIHDAREEKKRRDQEAERQKRVREEQRKQAMGRMVDQYGPMVTRVLTLLRDIAYPRYDVRELPSSAEWDLSAISIGSDATPVTVSCVLDDQNRPSRFRCRRQDSWGHVGECLRPEEGPVECGLTEQELITALQEVHRLEDGCSK